MRISAVLNEAEQLYKAFYLRQPAQYTAPISSWEAFKRRYEAAEYGTELPDTPPTLVAPCFHEDAFFFPALEDEVFIIQNARYCPPFWHTLEFIKIVYVYAGSCRFYMNDREYELKEGSFCIVGPHVRQAVGSSNDEDLVLNLLMRYSTFTESFSSLLTEQGIITDFLWRMLYNKTENIALLYQGKADAELQELVTELYDEVFQTENSSNLIQKSMMMIFCGQILRRHSGELEVLGGEKHRNVFYLPRILQYMRRNRGSVTLTMTAAYMGMSEGYLSRYIKRETGHTFSYLLSDMRMSMAEEMLRNTDFSIEKIIRTAGYIDKSQFYRNFERRNGITPLKYRKRHAFYEL